MTAKHFCKIINIITKGGGQEGRTGSEQKVSGFEPLTKESKWVILSFLDDEYIQQCIFYCV